LQQLAKAMDPLFPHNIGLQYLKEHYFNFYHMKYYELMSSKLGLTSSKDTEKIIDELIDAMHICGTHFTNFFRIIEEHSKNPKGEEELVRVIVEQSEPTEFYLKNIRAFNQMGKVDIKEILKDDPAFNPCFIT
jgi:uncharacterized protein YdiU (UPF0061 family)